MATIKWTESRIEDLLIQCQGREQQWHTRFTNSDNARVFHFVKLTRSILPCDEPEDQ